VVDVLLLLEQGTLHFEKMVQRKNCQAHAVVETTDLAEEDFPVLLEREGMLVCAFSLQSGVFIQSSEICAFCKVTYTQAHTNTMHAHTHT
jgi:hypothetical protein